jgi:cation transport regulator ChaC
MLTNLSSTNILSEPASMEPPKIYLFGYGSLINQASRQRTLKNTASPIPVVVSGFERSWGYKCPRKNYTAVSVCRHPSSTTNGVLIPVTEDDFYALDDRELDYARGKVDVSNIQTLDNTILNPKDLIYVYEQQNPLFENFSTTSLNKTCAPHTPSKLYPIPQSYLDCILAGCLQYGNDFARGFLTSTKGWKLELLLNDRGHTTPKCFAGSYCVVKIDSLLSEILCLRSRRLSNKL